MNEPDAALTRRVIEVAADVFGVSVDSISPADNSDTLEAWDSISHLNLILAIEETFGTAIPADKMPTLTSIEKIASEIQRLRTS